MSLKTIKPRLATLNTNRLKVLDTKAGATPRIRGSKWMGIRRQTMVAGNYACVDCGLVRLDNQADHDVPLEQGGSNDQSNLVVRCIQCHAEKSKREAKIRYGKLV